MAATLETHVLGYVLRQQLVHQVRREYEEIANSIQSPELLQNLPSLLANEEINWPHRNILCFPAFSESCRGSHDDQSPAGSDEERSSDPASGNVSREELEDIATSTPKQSPVVQSTSPLPSPPPPSVTPRHTNDDLKPFDSSSLECLIVSLPSDRESLLELKSQLTMELLWIKQAIASRQEYLQLKQHLQTEQTP